MLALSGDALIAAGAVVGAALITGPLLFVMARFDRRNTEQHWVNSKQLTALQEQVKQVHTDTTITRENLHTHIAWHAHDDSSSRPA